jgi:FKBP-type peptidyl-prolyl cis-trans isomerase (trigger factor)
VLEYAMKSKTNGAAVARLEDGTIQITFTIPWTEISHSIEETVIELAKNVDVPGFRKGKAPIEKARERLDKQYVTEHALSHILPKLFSDAIKENKLRPAMYPRFELLSAEEDHDWQVRANTAEIPEFDLGDYEKDIKKAFKDEEKSKKDKKELTRQEKENLALGTLQKRYVFKVAKILTDEEVNSRLASLLERLEKLGLSLESYLASINKTSEKLREEYAAAAEASIRMDIVLGAIAQKEKVTATEKEIGEFMSAANAANPDSISDSQKSAISSFLIKRKVLDKLASL